MKLRILASALLVILLSVGVSETASAYPHRGGWGYRGGWYGPRVGVRVVPPVIVAPPVPVVVPPVPVIAGGYYGGGYYGRGYYGRGYYGHGYGRGYYNRGGGYGHGGHRGWR